MRFELHVAKIEVHVHIHHDDEEALRRLKAAGGKLDNQTDKLKDAVESADTSKKP